MRSRFYDDFVHDALRGGVGQVVLLAAGLDTRAFRLGWPGDVTLYELDQPQVLAFKDDVLQRKQGAPSPPTRRYSSARAQRRIRPSSGPLAVCSPMRRWKCQAPKSTVT
nr:class I SAM-dependent methyltransferase [Parafrankia soli]